MRSRVLRATVLLAFLGAAGVVGLSAVSGGGSGRSSGVGDRYVGPVAPRVEVRFGLTLRMHSAALQRYAAAVGAGSDPALSAAQIGERFGVSRTSLARVRLRLARAGVHVREAFKQRTELLVSGSAARVEHLLGVRLGEYVDRGGRRYHRPVGMPVIPLALRSAVSGATQLDSKPLLLADDVPAGGMTASNLDTLYDIRPLVARGLDGRGQTIAVFSEDTFRSSDIAAFDREHQITGAPPVQRVEVNGPVAYQGGASAVEVDLDLEVIREMAPKAQIINYETCCGVDAFSPAIDKIVSDGRAKLVNFSYGYCELELTPRSALIAANNSFAAAEARGITVFASSGDQGSYECQRENRTDHRLSIGWPSSSPNVVSVGGTYIDLRQNGTRLDELGWEDILSRAGGGGGVSAVFARPSWQTGVPGVNNPDTTSPPRRQTPDVAADGSPASGYSIYSGGSNQEIGGTSAATPFWTGSFALIDELAERETGRALPFITPLLYAAAARDRSAFYDVTLGGNRFYRAGPGWDYSTGLGTPNMARLASDIIAEARRR
jgi:subtilase family serine protease